MLFIVCEMDWEAGMFPGSPLWVKPSCNSMCELQDYGFDLHFKAVHLATKKLLLVRNGKLV